MQTRSISTQLQDCQQSFDQISSRLLNRVIKKKLTIREEEQEVTYIQGKYFVQQGAVPLCKFQVNWLAQEAKEHFQRGPSLLRISSPVVVVGDIHGQFEDLVMFLETMKHPPATNYLFLGDYVDRGQNSIETICLLFAYSCKYPNNLFLLRGNHEVMSTNLRGGFHEECITRLDEECYENINEAFDYMPLAAVIDGETFCCHGGIGPHIVKLGLNGVMQISRPLYPRGDSLAIDLIWADPSKKDQEESFITNKVRNISYIWNQEVAEQFMKNEGLKMIVRAHESVMAGYERHPSGFTVFSAPDYVNDMGNDAALMIFINPGQGYKFVVYTKTSN